MTGAASLRCGFRPPELKAQWTTFFSSFSKSSPNERIFFLSQPRGASKLFPFPTWIVIDEDQRRDLLHRLPCSRPPSFFSRSTNTTGSFRLSHADSDLLSFLLRAPRPSAPTSHEALPARGRSAARSARSSPFFLPLDRTAIRQTDGGPPPFSQACANAA